MHLSKTLFAVAVSLGVCCSVYADHHGAHALIGVWNATAATDNGERDITWTFKKDGDRITGISHDHESGDDRNLDRITVKGKKVTLEVDIEQDGNEGVIKVVADMEKSLMLKGKWSVLGDDGQVYMSGDIEAEKEVAFAGKWNSVAELPDGSEHESVVHIEGANKRLTGVIHSDDGDMKLKKIEATENGLYCTFDYDMDGETIPVVIEAKLDDENKLVGEWATEDGAAEGNWTATRRIAATMAGMWDVTAEVGDNPNYKGTLKLEEDNGNYTGTSQSGDREAKKLATASVNGKDLHYTVPFERDGYSGTVEVKATLNGDGELVGKWMLTADGTEYASGKWEAKRN